MSTRTRKDWILWGALGCALVSTAHAEYTLATAAHFNEYVALAVPGALDLYVVRALQQRRDVFVAVLAMVAANVASHLIAGGVLEVKWPVIAAVGAVAPLIVWRVYSLKYESGTEPGAVSAPVPVQDLGGYDAGYEDEDAPAPVLEYGPLIKWGRVQASTDVPAAPDHVPGWMADEYPAEYTTGTESPVPHLKALPDLPEEYEASAVHSDVLKASDWAYLPTAQEYVDDVGNPTVRGLKIQLGIGQERAERLLAHLGVRP